MSAVQVAEPPREAFWDRYNRRFEFPLSALAAMLVHIGIAAILLVALVHLMSGSPKNSAMPLVLVPDLGQDDDGQGEAGSGGVIDPQVEKNADPWRDAQRLLPSPADLPAVQSEIRKLMDDDSGTLPVSSANAAPYKELDDTLRKKLLQDPGAKKGSGGEAGRGATGEKGAGPGGDSKDNSRARSLRWVLRFTTTDGRDYLNQLAAMNAEVFIPIPPGNKDAILFPDLKNKKNRRKATDENLSRLAGQVRFSDARADSVRAVCEELNVEATPRAFWAFFPKAVEDELLRKELGYRNRRPELIEETVFQIRVIEGKVQITVVKQTAKP